MAGEAGSAKPKAPHGPSMGRRDFVYAAGAIAGLACVGGAAKLAPGDESLIRPPGGGDEQEFFARCTRCDRCRSACPTRVIAPATLEDGLLSIRSPKINFKLGWCNFCGACAEVCPTGALATSGGARFAFDPMPDDEFFETSLVLGHAVVNEDRCIAWKGQSACVLCSQACPYEAISLDEYDRPVVDENACNGCGVCENRCPSSRLLSYGGGDVRGIEVEPALVR